MADPNAQPPPYSPPDAGWSKSVSDPAYPPATGMQPPPQQMGYAYPPQANQPMPAYPPANSTTVYSTSNSGAVRTVTVQQGPTTTSQVIVVGNTCPRCQIGILQESFTPLGICCAIFFFPLGLLCCLMMRNRHCPSCGAIYQ
ncbi:brain protein I3-like [Anneissia japonica]|uniref:brain protein I3-like n=1 Tax=Anneissia japonica TaxID=1529436 RepID=UPI0014259D25|nr:brain protein I3-like [Anneissia japonica]